MVETQLSQPPTTTVLSGYIVEEEDDWKIEKKMGVWLRGSEDLNRGTGTLERTHFQKNMFQVYSLPNS